MTDAHWNTDATAPVVPQDSSKDNRFVKAKPERKNPNDFGPGDNYLFVLPSSSNYEEVLASGQKYPWGWPYCQIKIKCEGDQYGRDLRVGPNNPLTKAFFDLYRAFGWGPKLKAIKEGGFNAGPDYRYLFNVSMVQDGKLSPVLFVRAGMKNPYKEEKGEGAKPKLREMLIQALTDGSDKIFARTSKRVFPAGLSSGVMLAVNIQFNGTFPQYLTVLPARDASDSVIVQDVSGLIPGFEPAKLDEARVWAETLDPLPGLEDIPAITSDGDACSILRISTAKAQTNSAQASVPEQAPVPARGPVAPPVPAPSQVMSQIPRGFGAPAQSPVPTPAQAPAPVTTPQGPPALKVPPKLSSFNANSAAAADDFARKLQEEQQSQAGKAPF